MDNLNNCLLIASQDLMDGFFEKKVIYIVEHTHKEGVLGFAINHPLRSIQLKNLLDYLNLVDISDKEIIINDRRLVLYQGGPANIERAFVLRVDNDKIEGSEEASVINESTQKLSLVQSSDELKSVLIDSPNDKSLFALGHSGWSPEQLEHEIELGLWHIAPFDEQLVFGEDNSDNIWERALQSINLDPNDLVNGLGHA